MQTIPETTSTLQAHTMMFPDAVRQVSALAQAKLPKSLHGRLQMATALALSGGVWVNDDGTTQVRCTNGWYTVNGTCPCPDHAKAEEGYCKHRLAKAIYRRAGELIHESPAQIAEAVNDAPVPAHGIPAQHIALIQGKPFVKFAGLLQMAHERGLVSLAAEWTHNDAELSLAKAVATFADGKRFEEAGDASPANVTKKVAAHFRRVALTRAKARVLRDALNIGICAIEELGEE